MAFQALRGFRDFYPEEMAVRRHIEQAWHTAARAAGFEEIDGPPLESLDLLKAKSGDAIVDEIYWFTDKGGREVGLRAELTPTVGRMVAAKAASLRKPIKWYAVPQLFRYQRQQRGRLREHIQWNVDIMGAPEIGADAEVLAVGLDALRRLGLTEEHVHVRTSHKALAESKLTELACTDFEACLRLIDKDALTVENAAAFLEESATKELIAWLDEPAESEELSAFLAACDDYGIDGYVEIDKHIVRGLAYYTGVVYEIFDRSGQLRAVAGGGRYDGLIERLGGPDMPALGFGMGDVVLTELLRDLDLLPERAPRVEVLVVPIGDDMLGPARHVVRWLRDQGTSAEAPYTPIRISKAFKAAESIGADRIALVGPDEWAEGTIKMKDLQSGEERIIEIPRSS